MNANDLVKTLKKMDLPNDSYSVLGKTKDESLCMVHEDRTWKVFYSERGMETDAKIFLSEDIACEYFLERITKWLQ